MIIGSLGFGLFIGFIIGWALAYMIVNGIAGVRLLKLNFASHPMSALITNEQLYDLVLDMKQSEALKLGNINQNKLLEE